MKPGGEDSESNSLVKEFHYCLQGDLSCVVDLSVVLPILALIVTNAPRSLWLLYQ